MLNSIDFEPGFVTCVGILFIETKIELDIVLLYTIDR